MEHGINIRNFALGDENAWFRLLKEAYGNLESRSIDEIRNLVMSKSFSSDWVFFGEANQEIVGSIRVKPLPHRDYYELWDLAVSKEHQRSQVMSLLIQTALSYLNKENAKYVKGYTLSIEPYVSAYVNHGFKPVRRILRIDWDLDDMLPIMGTRDDINVKDASFYEPEKIASIFVKSLAPFWNWWIEEEGGPEEVAKQIKEWLRKQRWFIAELNQEVLGLTGFSVGHGKMGKFIGVVVLPEHRMKRVGSTLMQSVLKEVRKVRLKSLRVYTMAYLDRLAPGAVLYLKSGGRITAEYLQLEK